MKNNKLKLKLILTLGLGLVLLAFGFLFQEMQEEPNVEVDTYYSNIDISDFDCTIVPQGGSVSFLVTARMFSPECLVGSVVNFRNYRFDIDMGTLGNVTWSGIDASGTVTTQSGGTVTMVNPQDADSDIGVSGDAMLATCKDTASSVDGSSNPCTTCTPDMEGYCTLCVIGNGSVQADWTFMVSVDIPGIQALGTYPITGTETFDSYFGDFLVMADDGVTYPATGQLPRAIEVVALDDAVCGSGELSVKVFLEGPYDSGTGLMTTILNDNHLLPGQDKLLSSQFVVRQFAPFTSFGQPYSAAPWNYTSTSGVIFGDASAPSAPVDVTTYDADVVDWVLVSVREGGVLPANKIWSCSGWLTSNGLVIFPEQCDFLTIDTSEDYYILIEHRNHLGILSPVPVNITVDGNLQYDFTTQDSYKPLVFRSAQKEVSTGVWAMIAGNGEQIINITAVNSLDFVTWSTIQNDPGYNYGDFDMNFIANSLDEVLFLSNQNKTTAVGF